MCFAQNSENMREWWSLKNCVLTLSFFVAISRIVEIQIIWFYLTSGIVASAFAPLGSPGRPIPRPNPDPVVLNEPVLKKIADKHKTTVALVS